MSQYNRNNEILKSFFKKPLTLVISILFFALAVIPCIYFVSTMITSGAFDSIPLCIYSLFAVLPATAFLNLYIKGKSDSVIRRLNTPLILLYIYTVPVVLFPALLYSMFFSSSATLMWDEFLIRIFSFMFLMLGLLFIIPILILLILQFVSMIITFHSIRKSANEIYLSGKGSGFMCVTSFLFAANLFLIALYFVSKDNFFASVSFEFIIFTIESAVLFALFVCLGIWSLMYSNTILKATVPLYGTNNRSDVKVQTLADAHTARQYDSVIETTQAAPNIVSQTVFENEKSSVAIPPTYEKTDVFTLPQQDEPNPYGNGNADNKINQQEETPNHMNFQNPYENFVPQNPFFDDAP